MEGRCGARVRAKLKMIMGGVYYGQFKISGYGQFKI